jgi:LPS-assembly lipoprotein
MKTQQRNALLLILCVSVVVSACGFQLRGSGRQSGSLVVGQVYIEESGSVSVVQQLRKALTAQQVQFAAFRADADTVISLSNEVLSRRVASISASGRVSEYELLHAIDLLTLRSREGVKAGEIPLDEQNLPKPQTVSVIRDYTYDETDVLAKNDEERILRGEMKEELVRHLVLRIFAGAL